MEEKSTKMESCSRIRDPPSNKTVYCENCEKQNKYVLGIIQCYTCNKYLCPNCDKQIHTLTAFKNHFRVAVRRDKQIHQVFCDSCLKTNNELVPTYFCLNCNSCLCGICNQQIHRIGLFSKHLVLPLQQQERKKKKKKKNTQIFCESCAKLGVETISDFYCNDCRLMLCKKCALSIHEISLFSDHKLEYLQPEKKKQFKVGENYERDIKNLKSLKKKLPDKAGKLFSLIKELKIKMEVFEFAFYEPIRLWRLEDNEEADEINEEKHLLKEIEYQRAYSSFVELLYNNPSYFGKSIAHIELGDSEKINPIILFKIYNHQFDPIEEKKLFEILEIAFDDDFAGISNFATLLRTNTPLTKLLVALTRRASGQQYLQELLSEPLTQICGDDELDIEIQPLRIWKSLQAKKKLEEEKVKREEEEKKRLEEEEKLKNMIITDELPDIDDLPDVEELPPLDENGNNDLPDELPPLDETGNVLPQELSNENKTIKIQQENIPKKEETPIRMTDELAMEDLEVQQIFEENVYKLGELCDTILEHIYNSIENMPMVIRKICSLMKQSILKHFPEAEPLDIASKIGGFYMLRFVNPAIVIPVSFNIIDMNLTTKMKRNLTLIGKITQLLSNMKTEISSKEQYLSVMTPWLQDRQERFANFLFEIADCEDIEINEWLTPYINLSFNNFMMNLTLNDISFLHTTMKNNILKLLPLETDPLLGYLMRFGPILDKALPRSEDFSMRIALTTEPNMKQFQEKKPKNYIIARDGVVALLDILEPEFDEEKFVKKDIVSSLVSLRKRNKIKEQIPDKKIKRILVHLKNLKTKKVLQTKKDFEKFNEDIINSYKFYNREHQEVISDLNLLISTSERLDRDYDAVKSQVDKYSANIRKYHGMMKDKSQLLTHVNKKKRKEITYEELESIKVLLYSEVPEERQEGTFFKLKREYEFGKIKLETYFGQVQEPVAIDTIDFEKIIENKIDEETIYHTDHYGFDLKNLIDWIKRTFL
ncbi:gtpase-activating protein [Anaeramoeba flamelloides]|uniref:Gtpase-activating protein n=1 Tax=Anaeramoeba flamelloides TaxID=1746091 RepID=A0AAV7Z9Q6_9EUKA|nr:gtpase-activating protein [Anaeramoeba flamelloides]